MLISLREYAEKNGKDLRSVRQKAQSGGFQTAVKIARNWLIDEDETFEDRRIISGKYIGQRRKKKTED